MSLSETFVVALRSLRSNRLRSLLTTLGIIIGVLAMTCDVFTIRRFFAVDHKWRWHFSAIALSVIGLLSVLLVQDIIHLIR